ncbi:ribonuclease II [Nocardioides sp. Soil797]|nr:ribonuclease II [Nocardioides sp. Soil797]
MPSRVVRVRSDEGVAAESLREGIAKIQQELHVSAEFPPEVEQAAADAAANPRLPELDRTDIPFVTIDPESAMDLDQALHIERNGEGYRVFYAIADLAAFITPGDPIDVEANRRGETLYGADSKIPLHPKVISEDAGSLLPDQVRPSLLWTIEVDAEGEGTDVNVERALVRSRAKLNYADVQKSIDDGSADEVFTLLQEVGELRMLRETARGGVSLPLPEQEIDIQGNTWHLEFRAQHPVEQWNAQISLLTGMAAASLMVYARVGLLRTLPPAEPRAVKRLHRTAKALGIEWPAEQEYPEFIRSLDPTRPDHAAMVVACTSLLRGSGYVGFNGELPEQPMHSAIAAEYAHVTAPLRRLVDRYAGEICVALCADEEVPDWVIEKLTEVPETMRDTGRLANQYENAVLNLVEAGVLQPRVGQSFDAVVVEIDEKDDHKGDITVQDPAIEASVTSTGGPLPLGGQVSVTLESADLGSRSIRFTTA